MDSNDEESIRILKRSSSLKELINTENIKREFFPEDKPFFSFLFFEKLAHLKFTNYYYHDKDFYNVKVINEIISNESTHIVAEFKDYLIMGDDSEFLQKYYNIKLSKKYLPKIFDYYKSCSVIFPNYVILPESKFIYKNIQKKQKVIDVNQEQEEKLEEIKSGKYLIEDNDDLFTTGAMYSILGQTNTSYARGIFGIKNEKSKEGKDDDTPLEIVDFINKAENNKQKNKIPKKHCISKNNSAYKKKMEINTNNITNFKEKSKKNSKEKILNINNINTYIKKSNNPSMNKSNVNNNASSTNSNNKINVNKIIVDYKKHRNTSSNIVNNNAVKTKIGIIKNNLGINNNNFEKTHIKQNTITNSNMLKQPFINNYCNTNNNKTNKNSGHINQNQPKHIIYSRNRLTNKKNYFLRMLFMSMKFKNKTQQHQTCKKINNDTKKSLPIQKHKKYNSYSLSPPSSFATIISRLNRKQKKISKRPINNKNFINSNSTKNIVKKYIYKNISVKENNYIPTNNNNNNNNAISPIPTHPHTEANVDKNNNNNNIIIKDNKNNYCTIVPQVLNMLNLNIYKINSFNKAQISNISNNLNINNKIEKTQPVTNKKIYPPSSDNTKRSSDSKKSASKNKKPIINKKNNIPSTARQFSSMNFEENNNVKNHLLSTLGSFGAIDPKKSIIFEQISKKKNNAVIPCRKNLKSDVLINKINKKSSSKVGLNNSINRKKKTKNPNLKNLKTDRSCKNSNGNSIKSISTICSVKSLGHIFRLKNKKSPSFGKKSLNFILNNK